MKSASDPRQVSCLLLPGLHLGPIWAGDVATSSKMDQITTGTLLIIDRPQRIVVQSRSEFRLDFWVGGGGAGNHR